jgi:hypothetical protein
MKTTMVIFGDIYKVNTKQPAISCDKSWRSCQSVAHSTPLWNTKIRPLMSQYPASSPPTKPHKSKYTLISYFFCNIHLILSSHLCLRLPIGHPLPGFPTTNSVSTPPHPRESCKPQSRSSIRSNIHWRIHIVKTSIMRQFSASITSSAVRVFSLSTLFSGILNPRIYAPPQWVTAIWIWIWILKSIIFPQHKQYKPYSTRLLLVHHNWRSGVQTSCDGGNQEEEKTRGSKC